MCLRSAPVYRGNSQLRFSWPVTSSPRRSPHVKSLRLKARGSFGISIRKVEIALRRWLLRVRCRGFAATGPTSTTPSWKLCCPEFSFRKGCSVGIISPTTEFMAQNSAWTCMPRLDVHLYSSISLSIGLTRSVLAALVNSQTFAADALATDFMPIDPTKFRKILAFLTPISPSNQIIQCAYWRNQTEDVPPEVGLATSSPARSSGIGGRERP